jgi:hypothetical protein
MDDEQKATRRREASTYHRGIVDGQHAAIRQKGARRAERRVRSADDHLSGCECARVCEGVRVSVRVRVHANVRVGGCMGGSERNLSTRAAE